MVGSTLYLCNRMNLDITDFQLQSLDVVITFVAIECEADCSEKTVAVALDSRWNKLVQKPWTMIIQHSRSCGVDCYLVYFNTFDIRQSNLVKLQHM